MKDVTNHNKHLPMYYVKAIFYVVHAPKLITELFNWHLQNFGGRFYYIALFEAILKNYGAEDEQKMRHVYNELMRDFQKGPLERAPDHIYEMLIELMLDGRSAGPEYDCDLEIIRELHRIGKAVRNGMYAGRAITDLEDGTVDFYRSNAVMAIYQQMMGDITAMAAVQQITDCALCETKYYDSPEYKALKARIRAKKKQDTKKKR
jgi:hypothetical protein